MIKQSDFYKIFYFILRINTVDTVVTYNFVVKSN